MNTIEEYLDEIEPDEVVPSIGGTVTKIKVTDSLAKLILTDSEDEEISLLAKGEAAEKFAEISIDDKIILTSSGGKKASKGLVLKEKDDGGKYILVGSSANVSVTEANEEEEEEEDSDDDDSEEDEDTEEEEKPSSKRSNEVNKVDGYTKHPADNLIIGYTLDRAYIHAKILNVFDSLPDNPILREKSGELATSIHINLERTNLPPLPELSIKEKIEVINNLYSSKAPKGASKRSNKEEEEDEDDD